MNQIDVSLIVVVYLKLDAFVITITYIIRKIMAKAQCTLANFSKPLFATLSLQKLEEVCDFCQDLQTLTNFNKELQRTESL